ncbi:PREDICTED: uncharacterized protein LOC104734445 [Camelina sativa]|uniref:Uncharacterized protein LOC104734445 n=1 Tax=Camelina sativa TaxID=90675 RepID=A0ABM0V7Y8_CAMSA|nr:PREDICTED: uncharacterized protein LOC104734445 [Camelina sativa]
MSSNRRRNTNSSRQTSSNQPIENSTPPTETTVRFMIWLAYQFNLFSPMVLTSPSHQWFSPCVMSIHSNRKVFVSGGLIHWCHLRFVTDESTPNLRFGEVIWVFNPGIKREFFTIEEIGLCDNFLGLGRRLDDGDVHAVLRCFMEKEFMATKRQRWIWHFKRHDPKPFQTRYQCILLIKIMQKAFGSFIYKIIDVSLLQVYEEGI